MVRSTPQAAAPIVEARVGADLPQPGEGTAWPPLAPRATGLLARAAKRGVDLSVAVLGLILTWPVLLVTVVIHLARGRAPLLRVAALGLGGVPFDLLSLAPLPGRLGAWLHRLGADDLPRLLHLLRGDLALVGPRPAPADELSLRDPLVRRRVEMRPGLVCLAWVRARANTDYEGELAADREYVDGWSLGADLRILLSAALVLAYGGRADDPPETVDVLGVPVANLTLTEAVEVIVARLDAPRPAHVAFLNAHNANVAARDPGYEAALRGCDLVLPDGIGVKLAGALLGQPVRQNVNGTDLFPRLCEALAGSGRRVYLLGGQPEVVEGVAGWIATHHPGVRVCGFHHGHFPAAEDADLARRVGEAAPDLLLVALGTPRQETWIRAHLAATGARVALGVGGLFDFYSGRIPRAPRALRDVGLEWAWRLGQEPARLWRRYVIGNPVFLARVMARSLAARLGRSSALHRG